MSKPDNTQELGEILAKTIYDTGAKLTEVGWERWGDNLEEAKQAIKQLVADEIVQLIGINEPQPLGKGWDVSYVQGKNNLRAEQRIKLAEWLKESKND